MTSWGHFVQHEILSKAYDDDFIQWGFKDITIGMIGKVCELIENTKKYGEGYRSATIIRALRNGDGLQHEQNLKLTIHDFNENVRFTY
jgi:hypothetical protein